MHEYILIISDTPRKVKIPEFSPSDLKLDGIADYISGEVPIPEEVNGIKIGKDGLMILTQENIKKYFRPRYMKCNQFFADMDLENFCGAGEMDPMYVAKLIEEKFSTYVIYIDEEGSTDDLYAETLDSFLRESWQFSYDCPEQKYYVIGCLDYHW